MGSFHGLDRVQPGFSCPDANGFLDIGHEDLAVADASGLGRPSDGVDRPLDQVIPDHDLDFHLGKKVDDVFCAAIELGMTLLPAETLGFGHGDALQSDLLERLLYLVQLEWLDDGFDFLHRAPPGHFHNSDCRFASRCARCAGCSIVCPDAQPGEYQHLPLSTIIQSRLPQKQGLCQVVNRPDFEMLSAFYQAFARAWVDYHTISQPMKEANRSIRMQSWGSPT